MRSTIHDLHHTQVLCLRGGSLSPATIPEDIRRKAKLTEYNVTHRTATGVLDHAAACKCPPCTLLCLFSVFEAGGLLQADYCVCTFALVHHRE